MDWAYIAGLFDHKGNINFIKVKNKEYIQLRVYSPQPELLEEIQKFIGCGNIYIKKLSKKNPKWQDFFELTITAKEEIFYILNQLLPYLVIKQEIVSNVLQWHPLFESIHTKNEIKKHKSKNKPNHCPYIG